MLYPDNCEICNVSYDDDEMCPKRKNVCHYCCNHCSLGSVLDINGRHVIDWVLTCEFEGPIDSKEETTCCRGK